MSEYEVARYDKATGAKCSCSCHLPVTVYYSATGKAVKPDEVAKSLKEEDAKNQSL